jgi:hypothetical protein
MKSLLKIIIGISTLLSAFSLRAKIAIQSITGGAMSQETL